MDENEEAERLLSQVRDQEPGSVQSLVGLAAVAARIALILLVLVQLNFFVGHVGVQLEALVYFPLTLGLLLFIIAAFYLPQLLRLKVAGIELEKSSTDQITQSQPLGIGK